MYITRLFTQWRNSLYCDTLINYSWNLRRKISRNFTGESINITDHIIYWNLSELPVIILHEYNLKILIDSAPWMSSAMNSAIPLSDFMKRWKTFTIGQKQTHAVSSTKNNSFILQNSGDLEHL